MLNPIFDRQRYARYSSGKELIAKRIPPLPWRIPTVLEVAKRAGLGDNGCMWPGSEQTQELLDQAHGGDDSAVNELMDRHRNSLRQLVRMRLDQRIQRRIDVSDVVQDILVEANRRLQRYLENPIMPFHLWLRQIARDRIIDAHRRHRVSSRRSVDREQPLAAPRGYDESSFQLAAIIGDNKLTPAAAALQKEIAGRIELAITKLDEKNSEIIIMRALRNADESGNCRGTESHRTCSEHEIFTGCPDDSRASCRTKRRKSQHRRKRSCRNPNRLLTKYANSNLRICWPA